MTLNKMISVFEGLYYPHRGEKKKKVGEKSRIKPRDNLSKIQGLRFTSADFCCSFPEAALAQRFLDMVQPMDLKLQLPGLGVSTADMHS